MAVGANAGVRGFAQLLAQASGLPPHLRAVFVAALTRLSRLKATVAVIAAARAARLPALLAAG